MTQEICADKEAKVDLSNIGFKALLSTLSNESYKTEEVITNFEPEDFSPGAVQEKYAELVHQTTEVNTAQASEIMTEVPQEVEPRITQEMPKMEVEEEQPEDISKS